MLTSDEICSAADAVDGSRTRALFGPGMRAALPTLLTRWSARRVLLVCGSGSAQRPWRGELERQLAFCDLHVHEHPARPVTHASVVDVAAAARAVHAGAIVAVGGGTVMDAAKAAVARLREPDAVPEPVRLVAVPTTPGSGAEVTPFATIWDTAAGRKRSLDGPHVAPDVAVVDPELTMTLTPRQTVAFAMDALTQGAEAVWSTRSTPISVAHGIAAVTLVSEACGAVLADPAQLGPRTAISLAGLLAGRAIAVSRTTACHAISYPLTLHYAMPHAQACSLTLGSVLVYNAATTAADCTDARGASHVRAAVRRVVRALGADDLLTARRRIDALRPPLDGEPLAQRIDRRLIAAEARRYGRLGNNPRDLSEDALVDLLADSIPAAGSRPW